MFSSLFLSHGAPLLAIEDGPAHRFLKTLSGQIGKPNAIILVSAHHIEHGVAVTTDALPNMIYDFGRFPDALFKIIYPAPGHPELASEIISELQAANFDARAQPGRGLDHGAWVPLRLIYPDADIPVVQVSINMGKSPKWHYRLGQTLGRLQKPGVLVIGSGSITHNLREWMQGGFHHNASPPNWVSGFTDWIAVKLASEMTDDVLSAVDKGPFGRRNHPSMDHILPLFVAMGAGGHTTAPKRLHTSTTYGVLGMDIYGFGSN